MNNIYCKIIFDGIYSGNIAKIEFYASHPFCVSILGKSVSIVGVDTGEIFNSYILPKYNKDKYTVCLEVVGVIHETPISVSQGDSGVETYGMQYFPFVSSFIDFNFGVLFGRIKSILIEVPKSCRMLWFSDKVIVNSKDKLEKVHSYGEKISSYVYNNKDVDLINTSKFIKDDEIKSVNEIKGIIANNNSTPLFHSKVEIFANFRFSGEKLGGTTLYLLSYFSTSIVGVWVVIGNPRLIMAGVVAYLVVMVKFFQNSNPPQARTILMSMMMTTILLLALSGLSLIAISLTYSYQDVYRLSSYIFAAIILFFSVFYVFLAFRADREFASKGRLPVYLERFFYQRRKKSELKNKSKFQ